MNSRGPRTTSSVQDDFGVDPVNCNYCYWEGKVTEENYSLNCN